MVFAINVDQQTYTQFEKNAENAAVPATPKIKGRTIAIWNEEEEIGSGFYQVFVV